MTEHTSCFKTSFHALLSHVCMYQVIMQQNQSRGQEIIEKAERQLLPDRVRGINRIIEESGNNINNSKTRLASLVTNADLDRCSKFIDKVREDRYSRVKARQVRKLHNLISKSNNNSANNNNNRLVQVRNAISSDRSNSNRLNMLQINHKTISITNGSSIYLELV